MKKFGHILALVAVMVAFAGTALAGPKINTLAPMNWDRGAGTDSTFISIPVWVGAIAITAAQETTAWLDLGKFEFPDGVGSATPVPLVQFQITVGTVAATTSDSVGYQVQYANDPADLSRTTGFINGTQSYAAMAQNVAVITALDATRTAASASGRFIRLIVTNAEIGSGYQRRFRVVPIIYGKKD
jgi:hypothetical protein